MRISILDACFSEHNQSGRGMAAEYLSWELRRRKKQEYSLAESDTILVTCPSPIDVDYVRKLRNRYPKKTIICGGSVSTAPYSIGQYCDMVCVGDGQKFMETLLNTGLDAAKRMPNVWIHGDDRDVEIDQNFPWNCPPIKAEDGAVRVWCGRGCKNKCAFCQTGWAYVYSENPYPDQLLQQIDLLKRNGQRIAYLSNDVAQHSFFNQLAQTDHGSYSVKFLKKHGLPPARQIRLGIEGVSKRLRTFVSKPISNDDLVKCTAWLNANGKSVRWFLIAGLPGETAKDWEDLKTVILHWKRLTSRGVLGLSFTAWCPEPATPLATMPLRDDYWELFSEFKEWFFAGRGWSNRIKLMSPQQPESRLKKAMLTMGLNESELRKGGNWGPNDRLQYPYKRVAKNHNLVFSE